MLQQRLRGDDGAPARPRLPAACSIDYPRRQRSFIVAPQAIDTVSSEWLIKGGDGQAVQARGLPRGLRRVRPRGAPSRWRRSRSCSSRPAGLEPGALVELRDALATAPEHFTEDNLERAHQAAYHKALVDIISMVKHAARETAPLLTAEERVEAAMRQVTAGRDLTDEQAAWLERIRLHLIAEPLDRPRGLRARPGAVRPRRLGQGRPRASTGSSRNCWRRLNKELAAA